MVSYYGDFWMAADEVSCLVESGGYSEELAFHRGVSRFCGTVEASTCHNESPFVRAAENVDVFFFYSPSGRVTTGDLIQGKTGSMFAPIRYEG